jgi:hypothetical protein
MAANTPAKMLTCEGKIKSHKAKKGEKPVDAVPFNLVLDFSACSPEEVLELAKDGIIVSLQSRTRSAFWAKENMGKDGKSPVKSFPAFVKEHMSGKIDVKKAVVDKQRLPGKSLVEKTADMLKGMSPEQRKAILAQLQAAK